LWERRTKILPIHHELDLQPILEGEGRKVEGTLVNSRKKVMGNERKKIRG
jgi:hypothetical protein